METNHTFAAAILAKLGETRIVITPDDIAALAGFTVEMAQEGNGFALVVRPRPDPAQATLPLPEMKQARATVYSRPECLFHYCPTPGICRASECQAK